MVARGKGSNTQSEAKPVKDIIKNLQSFLETSPMQKGILISHKLQGHAYE